MRITKKQAEILKLVCTANRDDLGMIESWIDIDQLVTRVSYQASKQALQCSVRIMEERGLVIRGAQELRRHRLRRVVQPTTLGTEVYNRNKAS